MSDGNGDIFKDRWTEVNVRWDFALQLVTLLIGAPLIISWFASYMSGKRVSEVMTYGFLGVGAVQIACTAHKLFRLRRNRERLVRATMWFALGYISIGVTFAIAYGLVSVGWEGRRSGAAIIGLPLLAAIIS